MSMYKRGVATLTNAYGVDVDLDDELDWGLSHDVCNNFVPQCHFTAAQCLAQDSLLSEVQLYAFGVAYTIYAVAYFSRTILKSIRPPFPSSSMTAEMADLAAVMTSVESSCTVFGPDEASFEAFQDSVII